MITESVPEFKQRQTNICGSKEPKDYRNLENCSNRLKIRNLQGNTWDRNARQNVLESRDTMELLHMFCSRQFLFTSKIELSGSANLYLQKQSMGK